MKVNGVSFNEKVAKSISRNEFIQRHMFCYKNKPENERRLFLGEIHDRINGVEKVEETTVKPPKKSSKKAK